MCLLCRVTYPFRASPFHHPFMRDILKRNINHLKAIHNDLVCIVYGTILWSCVKVIGYLTVERPIKKTKDAKLEKMAGDMALGYSNIKVIKML